MAFSEIDDIFAGKVSKESEGTGLKSKGKSKVTNDSKLPTPPASTKSGKKKAKKRKRREPDNEHTTAHGDVEAESEGGLNADNAGADGGVEASTQTNVKRARLVETVQDPSATLPKLAKTRSEKTKEKTYRTGHRSEEKKGNDLERFKDPRGSGPRKRTEEGFLVYKEDELGIRDESGDTPLCPFDCNCFRFLMNTQRARYVFHLYSTTTTFGAATEAPIAISASLCRAVDEGRSIYLHSMFVSFSLLDFRDVR